MNKAIYIVGAQRTAMGAFCGSLSALTATDLAAHVTGSALSAAQVDPSLVSSVIFGNVAQTSTMAPYLARHAALMAGCAIETPCLTVNRLCGSGFQSVINGAHEILLGESEIVVAGGAENMTQAPYAARGLRERGQPLGLDVKLEDTLWATLTDGYIKTPMGITAENLAKQYKISRQETDEYACLTQQRWKEANERGVFKAEISPITVKAKKSERVFDTDEHPRPQTTMETLGKLPAVFEKNGTVTAGNASGISDGAAALVLASEDAVKKHGLTPLAKLVSWHVSGVDPSIMGIGPAPAIRGALAKANLQLDDMEHVEVNEAFGPQYIAVERELQLNRAKTNLNGGAIALGHPLAASGARILTHLVHAQNQNKATRKSNFSVGSACIGGGQGIAVILEAV